MQALPSKLASAMAPFFPHQAQQYAHEVLDFMAAGLSVPAYDQAVFGQQPAARAAAAAGAGQQQAATPGLQQQQQQLGLSPGMQQEAAGQQGECSEDSGDMAAPSGAAGHAAEAAEGSVGSWAAQAAELTGSWREA